MPKSRSKALPKDYISFTQCSTYARCPRLYHAKYFDGKEQDRNYPMKFGHVMHLAARALNILAQKRKVDLDPGDVAKVFKAAMKDEVGAGEIPPADIALAERALTRYAWSLSRTVGRMHGSEVEVVVPYQDGVGLKVIIDRIDTFMEDGLEIIDFKTSREICSKAELREDPQLLTYAYAASLIVPGIRRFKLTHWMFRHDPPENSVEIDADNAMGVKDWIDSVITGIKAGQFEPRVNQYCHNCPVRSTCPAYSTQYVAHHEEIKDAGRAIMELKDVDAKISIMTARKKALRGVIGSRVEESGPIEIDAGDGKRVWNYWPEDSRTFPPRLISGLFREYGLDILDYMDLSASSFEELKKKLFKLLPEEKIADFKAKAEGIIKIERRTKLAERKPKSGGTDGKSSA